MYSDQKHIANKAKKHFLKLKHEQQLMCLTKSLHNISVESSFPPIEIYKYLSDTSLYAKQLNQQYINKNLLLLIDSFLFSPSYIRLIHSLVFNFTSSEYDQMWINIVHDENCQKYMSLVVPNIMPINQPNDVFIGMNAFCVSLHLLSSIKSDTYWTKLTEYTNLWDTRIFSNEMMGKLNSNDDLTKTVRCGYSPLFIILNSIFKNDQHLHHNKLFWVNLSKQHKLWGVQNIDGVTPLHLALYYMDKHSSDIFGEEFWTNLSKHNSLWNKRDKNGITPLHIATKIVLPYDTVWENLAFYSTFWGTLSNSDFTFYTNTLPFEDLTYEIKSVTSFLSQMPPKEIITYDILFGTSPLYIFVHNKGLDKLCSRVCNMLAKNKDIWKVIQQNKSKDISSISPIILLLYNPVYIPDNAINFFIELGNDPDLWKIEYESPDPKRSVFTTALSYACSSLNSMYYLDFWLKLHSIGLSLDDDLIKSKNSEHPFRVLCGILRVELYNAFFYGDETKPIYNIIKKDLKQNLIFSMFHGCDDEKGFVLRNNITVINLVYHGISGLDSGNFRDIDAVLYKYYDSNLLRIYKPGNFVPNISFGRFGNDLSYGFFMYTPDGGQIQIDKIGNIDSSQQQFNFDLYELINELPRDKEIILVNGSCRVGGLAYEKLCKWVSLTPFFCDRPSIYSDLCRESNDDIFIKHPISRKYSFGITPLEYTATESKYMDGKQIIDELLHIKQNITSQNTIKNLWDKKNKQIIAPIKLIDEAIFKFVDTNQSTVVLENKQNIITYVSRLKMNTTQLSHLLDKLFTTLSNENFFIQEQKSLIGAINNIESKLKNNELIDMEQLIRIYEQISKLYLFAIT